MREVTAVLLTLALLFGTVECKASCAAQSCAKAPPCHGHKTLHACSNELVVDRPVAAAAAMVVMPEFSVECSTPGAPAPVYRTAAVSIDPPLRI